MDEYEVVLSRSARKELEALPDAIQDRVLARVVSLTQNPRPTGCRKLAGSDSLWRLRVGDYRVLFGIDDRVRLIDIVAVRHRSDAYR